MKKVILPIVFLLFAFSVQAADVKIAYVDLRKIVTESDQGKDALKTLDSIEKAKKAIMKEKVDSIKKLEEEMTKQGSVLNAETKEKKQTEHDKLVEEYQKMRRDSEAELQKNEAEFIQQILLNVKKLLAEIAEKEGYAAILDKPAVVYIDDKYDLTERVMKQFNEISKEAKKSSEK